MSAIRSVAAAAATIPAAACGWGCRVLATAVAAVPARLGLLFLGVCAPSANAFPCRLVSLQRNLTFFTVHLSLLCGVPSHSVAIPADTISVWVVVHANFYAYRTAEFFRRSHASFKGRGRPPRGPPSPQRSFDAFRHLLLRPRRDAPRYTPSRPTGCVAPSWPL